jgi:predicted DNA-binding mobile mystery protein A
VLIHRALIRRRLDERLLALGAHVGAVPPHGWIATLRRALGMTSADVARRMGISQQRASQLEEGERDGSLRLSTLRRAAAALECHLLYVLVPDESLETMVRRHARAKAAEEIRLELADAGADTDDLAAAWRTEMLEARMIELVDSPGLWRASKVSGPGPPPRV